MNYAVLLSGGSGSRVSTDIPKQYIKSGGIMMAVRALKGLIACERIDAVFIVAAESWRAALDENIRSAGIDTSKLKGYATPGKSRRESIVNAMDAIASTMNRTVAIDEEGNADTVLFHDAARPFLTVELLDCCYNALTGHDGVMPVLPMKDTVYRSVDGKSVTELLNRDEVFAGQAPELFIYGKYLRANRMLPEDKRETIRGATEPAVLFGMDIAMIPGDEHNYKVTTDEDLQRFLEETGGAKN